MKRIFILLYGILSYTVGMGGLTYFILFVGGWSFLPMHVDSGTPSDLGRALLMNALLILIFGLQHSVMARPGFKQKLTKVLPRAAERSTYVLVSGLMMLMLSFFWQPLNGTLWQVENSLGQTLLTGGYIFGWLFAVLATFVINHFELFGLQRVWLNLRNKPEPEPFFTERFLYRVVRHPLQLGVLIGMWVTPTMSMTHLVLSVAMTAYIFVGLYFEEKDLVASLGHKYADYQQRVPKILPWPRPNDRSAEMGTIPNLQPEKSTSS